MSRSAATFASTGHRLSGRRALITGGASGIGLATAGQVLREGGMVALLDRNVTALAAARDHLKADFAHVCDVRDAAAVEASVDMAAEALGGPLDLLVNAAGIYRVRTLVELEPAEWDDVLAVNLRATYLVARAVGRRLIEARVPGSIINISSVAALVGDATEPGAHYSASKAGVIALTRQMAVEWAPHGIRANAVCPGLIDTPMLRIMDVPEKGAAYVRGFIPQRRLGTAAEVASVITFLASAEAAYVTGAAISIDGGLTAC